jgi:hypothetical protein
MVTKHIQITEDDHTQRAFALAKAAGNQRYPRTTTTTVRESVGSGFEPQAAHKIDMDVGLRLRLPWQILTRCG